MGELEEMPAQGEEVLHQASPRLFLEIDNPKLMQSHVNNSSLMMTINSLNTTRTQVSSNLISQVKVVLR